MNESKYSVLKLNKEHNRTDFTSGSFHLDHYLANQAGQDMKRYTAVTYALVEPPLKEVLGYYTLSATSIELKSLSEQEKKRLPRYPLLPATLIGRLAVDKRYQGKGIGQLLLIHALKVSLENSGEVASMAVIVDAKDDRAVRFYQHFGFVLFLDIPKKLYLSMETIRKMLRC